MVFYAQPARQRDAVPLTRYYIGEAEQRLRLREHEPAALRYAS